MEARDAPGLAFYHRPQLNSLDQPYAGGPCNAMILKYQPDENLLAPRVDLKRQCRSIIWLIATHLICPVHAPMDWLAMSKRRAGRA